MTWRDNIKPQGLSSDLPTQAIALVCTHTYMGKQNKLFEKCNYKIREITMNECRTR